MGHVVRSAQSESDGRIVLIDTDSAVDVALLADLGEPQLLVRDSWFMPPAGPGTAAAGAAGGKSAWRLVAGGGGTLEDLVFQPCPEVHAPLQPGHVGGGVSRDESRRGGRAGDVSRPSPPLGAEGARVIEIGPEVTGVTVGDLVVGFPGRRGSAGRGASGTDYRTPQGWTPAEAAAVPVVFLTALFGLADLAAIRAGESLLIHAGTGGVGMAAVQLAASLGVEVFVTASRGKWDAARHGV